MDKEVFQVTREELDALKAEIEGSKTPRDTLEKFASSEYFEAQIREKWLAWVSIDSVSQGIQSPKLESIRADFEKLVDTELFKSPFLDDARKWVMKLAISNRMMSMQGVDVSSIGSFVTQSIANGVQEMKSAVTGESVPSSTQTVASWPLDKVMAVVGEYTGGLTKLQTRLDAVTPALTDAQKKNIVSQIGYFSDPKAIEHWFPETVLTECDDAFIHAHREDTQALPVDMEALKNYMVSARTRLESGLWTLEKGQKALETTLSLVSNDGMIGESAKGILKFLLGLPLIGKLIGAFLGLDSKDPMADLENQTKLFEFQKTLKGFWVQKDAQGQETSKGEGVFEWIDFSGLEYASSKDDLKKLMALKPEDMKSEDFWKQVMGAGIPKDGVTYKLTLPEAGTWRTELTSKILHEMVLDADKRFAADKASKTRAEQEVKNKALLQETSQKREQASAQAKVATEALTQATQDEARMQTLIARDITSIDQWDGWFINGKLKNLPLQELVDIEMRWGKKEDYEAKFKDVLGEWDYANVPQADKDYLHAFCKELTGFLTTTKKTVTGSLGEYVQAHKTEILSYFQEKQKGYHDLVAKHAWEKKTAEWDVKQEEQKANEVATRQEITKRIEDIKTPTKLTGGIDLGEGRKLQFFPETQTFQVGDRKFKMTLSDTSLHVNEIIIEEKTVKLEGTKNLGVTLSWTKEMTKDAFVQILMECLTKWDYAYNTPDGMQIIFSQIV